MTMTAEVEAILADADEAKILNDMRDRPLAEIVESAAQAAAGEVFARTGSLGEAERAALDAAISVYNVSIKAISDMYITDALGIAHRVARNLAPRGRSARRSRRSARP